MMNNTMSSFFTQYKRIPRSAKVIASLWGGIVFLMVCIAILFFVYIPHIKTQVLQEVKHKYSYLNPTLAILDKKDMIVDFQRLRESLTSRYEKRGDYLVSIYFEYLPTGANIAVNKDEKIWPASLIKIPVAMAAMKKVQDKKWKISNELVILDDDKDRDYGVLYKSPTGTTLTIEKFLEESLINSDNTAHFVLLRNTDPDELEEVYDHLGLDDIIDTLKRSPDREAFEDNRITAKRYTIFFRSLYNATFLDQEYSQKFLSILSHAPKELLSNGLPEGVVFVHKTGVRVDEAVRADSGIVYAGERPYLLTVMVQDKRSKELNEEEVAQIFTSVSQEVYHYVANAH